MKHLKHKSIRMLVYKGVASQGYIQPHDLAKFDIVITTYETLSRELNYVDLPHSNSQLGRRYAFNCNLYCSFTSLLYCGYTNLFFCYFCHRNILCVQEIELSFSLSDFGTPRGSWQHHHHCHAWSGGGCVWMRLRWWSV